MLLWKKHIEIKEVREKLDRINMAIRKLNAATTNYGDFQKIGNLVYWGEEVPKEVTPMWGDDAERAAELANIRLGGKLLAECKYIFRWSRDHKTLVPRRVSMSPKTWANIYKGHRRYGVNEW